MRCFWPGISETRHASRSLAVHMLAFPTARQVRTRVVCKGSWGHRWFQPQTCTGHQKKRMETKAWSRRWCATARDARPKSPVLGKRFLPLLITCWKHMRKHVLQDCPLIHCMLLWYDRACLFASIRTCSVGSRTWSGVYTRAPFFRHTTCARTVAWCV